MLKGDILNLFADSLGLSTIVGGWITLLIALAWAIKTAPWNKVDGDKAAQHVWLGMTVIVFLVWQFGASLGNGITFHFLLMTLMVLMFTPQFALLGMLLALLGVTFTSDLGWTALGINALIMGIVPIFITWMFYRIGARFLEANFFVYVFYNGFFAAAVSVVVALALATFILLANDVYSYEYLKQSFIPYIPLMATPEGFVNGILLAALILLKPNWLSTFHDENYINGK